jgi:hypothetical protein
MTKSEEHETSTEKQETGTETHEEEEEKEADSILLRDLAPRANVRGGAGKLRLGESTAAELPDAP